MKHTFRLLFALALPLALVSHAKAGDANVATLSTSTVSTIVIPGPHCLWIVLSNATAANGGAQVNLGLDGGTQWTDPNNKVPGVDPTTGATGKGTWLAPGASITLYGPWFTGVPIRAIMATGTTILNVSVSDNGSSFPTP